MTSFFDRLNLKALQGRRATENVVTSPAEKAEALATTQEATDLRSSLGIVDEKNKPHNLSNLPQCRE